MRRVMGVVAAVALTIGVLTGLGPSAPTAIAAPVGLPDGFVITQSASGQGPGELTDLAYLPDGSMLTIGKSGRVAWVSADGSRTRTLATLPVVTKQDLGLVALELAPDFATSRTFYLSRSLPDGVPGRYPMRLASWRLDGGAEPTGISAERTVLEVTLTADIHGIWDVVADTDGSLWVAVGDGAKLGSNDAHRAQNLDDLRGKVLRLNPDGSGVPANPFYAADRPRAARSLVYASGFRSPFRMTLDPRTGTPVLGDVGWYSFEEVNTVRSGASHGWPCFEGGGPAPFYREQAACAGKVNTAPTHFYGRAANQTSSVTGGVFYTGDQYPAQYRGAYFFGDYVFERIWSMQIGTDGRPTRAPERDGFGRDIGLPVAFTTGPGGDVVYADIGSGRVNRLSYVEGNRPPHAEATTSTDAATRTVVFDASPSYDLDGHTMSYRWDFGDGATGTGRTVSHTYDADAEQTLTARLTVTDQLGASSTASITVAPANNPPVLTVDAPDPSIRYGVGQVVSASATATDVEDGDLTVTWHTTGRHCRGESCHDHPSSAPSGPDYAQVFEDHGDDTYLQVRATATDSLGVSTSRTFEARPDLRTLTLTSNVPAEMTIDDGVRNTADVTVGEQVLVIAPELAADGVSTFASWSDGGERAHQITVGSQSMTLDAVYRTPIDQRYQADPAVRAAIGAPTGVEQGDTALRWRDHANGRIYWSREHGVHFVAGAIAQKFAALGSHTVVGVPITDEVATPGKPGAFNDFATGKSIYWSPNTPASVIEGRIKARWGDLGWEQGTLGFPRTDEMVTPDGIGRFNQFENGSVYWSPATDAWAVQGAILAEWGRTGYELGPLGYPRTNETRTPDGRGRFNHFQNGSVYWTPTTGARDIRGAIRTRWQELGWERSYLGYPTSGEFAVSGGRRSNFERGYIVFDFATGRTTDRRY